MKQLALIFLMSFMPFVYAFAQEKESDEKEILELIESK